VRSDYNSKVSISMEALGLNGLLKIVEEDYMNIHIGAGISKLSINAKSDSDSEKYPGMAYSIFGGAEWFLYETPNLGFFVQMGYGWIDFKQKETETYSEYIYNPGTGYYEYVQKAETVTYGITPGATMMRWGIHYYF